jgi:hypothetical protein
MQANNTNLFFDKENVIPSYRDWFDKANFQKKMDMTQSEVADRNHQMSQLDDDIYLKNKVMEVIAEMDSGQEGHDESGEMERMWQARIDGLKEKYETIISGIKQANGKKIDQIQKANSDKINALYKEHDISKSKLSKQINDLSTK